MVIFYKRELPKTNLFNKIFGIRKTDNAIIEINNLFADHQEEVDKISLAGILGICEKYRVELIEIRKDLFYLFRAYIKHSLADNRFDETEIKNLWHLREILMMTEKEVSKIIEAESSKIYKKEIGVVLKDRELDDTEKKNLERIVKELLLSDEVAESIYSQSANELFMNLVSECIFDERLTPEEEKLIDELARKLSINPDFFRKERESLERFKLYWQIENGDLPVLQANIDLQKNEVLHFHIACKLFEQRTITERIKYAGPAAKMKVKKGIDYQDVSVKAQTLSKNVWEAIGNGTLFLTNKRIIFKSPQVTHSINLNSVIDFKDYPDGIEIQKDGGKNQFYEFSQNTELLGLMLTSIFYRKNSRTSYRQSHISQDNQMQGKA